MTSNVRPWTTRLASFVPEWLARRPELEWAAKFMWALAFLSDRAAQVALEGMRAGWPGYDGRTDNFSLLGQSRGLVQGESESALSFGRRLRSWLTLALDLGGDGGLALELHWWLSTLPMVRIWSRNGKCVTCCPGSFSMTAGSTSVTASSSQTGILSPGDVVVFQPGPAAPLTIATVSGTSITLTTPWTGSTFSTAGCVKRVAKVLGGWSGTGTLSGYGLNWDSVSNPERAQNWWDIWIVIYSTELANAPAIDAAPRDVVIPFTDPQRRLGIGHLCTRIQRDTVQGLIRTWKGQHASVRLVVWSPDSTLFDPGNPGASGNPNGTWGKGSFFGTCPSGTVGSGIGLWPSRNRSCRYWQMRA